MCRTTGASLKMGVSSCAVDVVHAVRRAGARVGPGGSERKTVDLVYEGY